MRIQEQQATELSNADYFQISLLLNRSGQDHLSDDEAEAIYERFDRLPLTDRAIERIGTMAWVSTLSVTDSERKANTRAGKVVNHLAEIALLKADIITAERAAEYVSLLPGFRNRRKAAKIYNQVGKTIDFLV